MGLHGNRPAAAVWKGRGGLGLPKNAPPWLPDALEVVRSLTVLNFIIVPWWLG